MFEDHGYGTGHFVHLSEMQTVTVLKSTLYRNSTTPDGQALFAQELSARGSSHMFLYP